MTSSKYVHTCPKCLSPGSRSLISGLWVCNHCSYTKALAPALNPVIDPQTEIVTQPSPVSRRQVRAGGKGTGK